MKLLYKDNKVTPGLTMIIDSENSLLRILSMGRLYLNSKDSEYILDVEDREMAINVISGRCKLNVKSKQFGEISYEDVGKRQDPFSGLPTMVYIPRGSNIKIASLSSIFDAIVYFAPSSLDSRPVVVEPEDAIVSLAGRDNWAREVRIGIGENVKTQSLIVGETLNPPGNWSGYPPHKHDEDKPPEYPQEEAYFFLFRNGKGFCFIRLYSSADGSKPFDIVYTVKHNDAVAIPQGYHTIANAPGYELCYFFALAGKDKHFGAVLDDPEHVWIK